MPHIFTNKRLPNGIANQLLSNQEPVIEPISTFLNKYENDINYLIKNVDKDISTNLIKLQDK